MSGKICLRFAGGVVCLALAGGAAGQTFQGSLRGTVRDPQGVVPGATVTVVNEATNVSRETVTNEVGAYAFPALAPGTYTIRVSMVGYKTVERKGIIIETQRLFTLDVQLELGAIQESITVTGETPLIDTSTASTATMLDRKLLESLPTPGRNAFLIGVTAPTMIRTGDLQWDRQQDQTNASLISLGGGTRRGNNYLLDGFPITDMRNRSVINPSLEAVEEVKVQVHTYDAEMSRTGGGVFNVTGKSGTNEFHGAGLFQTRPTRWLEQNFFLKRQGVPKVDQYYRLYAYGVGGPIVRNRTFFWTALEGYRSMTTRNGSLIFPTDRERRGDFSQSGVTIYDPLTTRLDPVTGQYVREPFPGNVIPANRINPVAAKILSYVPKPDVDRSDGKPNYVRTAEIVDKAQMMTAKIDHKFTDAVSLSGMYVWNFTREPSGGYWETNLFASPEWRLARDIHIIVLNNNWVLNDTTVMTLRAGWNRFGDNMSVPYPFDPADLGFSRVFLDSIQMKKFPAIFATDYGEVGTDYLAGWESRDDIRWSSWGFNGTVTKLAGRHSVKLGAEYRILGLDTHIWGQASGSFTFDRSFTQGPNPLNPSASSGNAIADLLLGYPASGSVPITSPLNVFVRYSGGYIQDDFRVSSRLSLNYGVRFEQETGLRERNNRFTVGFDENAVSPLNNRVRLPDGRTIKGGLVYAGVNGAPTEQGDQPPLKVGPRAGLVWSIDDDTVVRGGYGILWAPWNYPYPGTVNYGNMGYTQITYLQQDRLRPFTTLDNPFPTGLEQPAGNSLGLLTGVGGDIYFIDPKKGAPRVQQWSVDMQRQLPGNMAVTVGYMGAAGDHLSVGGTVDSAININQLDPSYLAMGPALLERVPNPFYGVPEAGGFASLSTIERGQLLRPFPQFRNVYKLQSTVARSRYHALVLQLEKRVTGWWGGRFNYTLSRLKDNQFGESNFYSARPGVPLNNYDLEAEYGVSLLDVPHKVALSPVVRLPFGVGRPYLNRGGWIDYLLGGWEIAAIVTLESGFPFAVGQTPNNSGLFGSGQRPNVVPGVNPKTSGSTIDRLGGWVNPAAWSLAPAYTFGNAPRTDTRVRTPARKNLDIVFAKAFRTGGSTRAELRIELLNATNTPKFREVVNTFGSRTFGQITRQAGFMRIVQIGARFVF